MCAEATTRSLHPVSSATQPEYEALRKKEQVPISHLQQLISEDDIRRALRANYKHKRTRSIQRARGLWNDLTCQEVRGSRHGIVFYVFIRNPRPPYTHKGQRKDSWQQQRRNHAINRATSTLCRQTVGHRAVPWRQWLTIQTPPRTPNSTGLTEIINILPNTPR